MLYITFPIVLLSVNWKLDPPPADCRSSDWPVLPTPIPNLHCSSLGLSCSTGSKMAVRELIYVRPCAILLTVLSARSFWTGFVYRMASVQYLIYIRPSCHDMYDWTGSNATAGSNWRIAKGVPTVAPIYNSTDLKMHFSGWLNKGTLVVRMFLILTEVWNVHHY